MINRIATLSLAALFLTSACSGVQSRYAPTTLPADEIGWTYDGALAATKAGDRVAEAPNWSGLSDSIKCVAKAHEIANEAEASGAVGKGTGIAAMTLGLGGIAAGTGMMITSIADDSKDGLLMPGLATLGTGVVVGAILAAISGTASGKSNVKGVDAINMYNDTYESTPACTLTMQARK